MSELSDSELLALCEDAKARWVKLTPLETLGRLRTLLEALPRLIARAQKAETDCTDLVGVAYHKGYHEGYRAAIQSQERP